MRLGLKGRSGLDAYFERAGGREFPFPEIAGTYSGKLVVCGDAACVWDDLHLLGCASLKGKGRVEWRDHDDDAHFMTVNKLGEVFPGRIEHWYSNDAKLLNKFAASRRQEYEFGPPGNFHSCNRPVQHRWPWRGHGTSGLSAVLTGLALGYDRIYVCGMPLDNSPHNGEPPWRKANFTNEVSDQVNGKPDSSWLQAIRYAFEGRVEFMSGRPKDWMETYSCG